MAYNKDEFLGMRYDVSKEYSANFKRVFPDLYNYLEFVQMMKLRQYDFDKLFRYIAYLYDLKSPVLRYNADIRKRKVEAAKLADFPMDDNMFEKKYMDIMQGIGIDAVVVNKAVIRYCRMQNEHLFVQLAAFDQKNLDNAQKLLETTDATEQKNILSNMKSLSTMITDIRTELFSDDNSKKLYNELMEEVSNYNLELTPEQMIINLEARKLVLEQGSPYKNYLNKRFELTDMDDKELKKFIDDMSNNTKVARKHFSDLGIIHEGEISIKKRRGEIIELFRNNNAIKDMINEMEDED